MAYTSDHLRRTAGITRRQIDYWCSNGWIVPFDRPPGSGTGVPLEWPEKAVRKARLMNSLIGAGLTPEKANEVAEGAIEYPAQVCESHPYQIRTRNIAIVIYGE